MKKLFPPSLLMGPAYLILGLVNLYVGRIKKNWGSTIIGMVWMGVSACWTVLALFDIRDAKPEERQKPEFEED